MFEKNADGIYCTETTMKIVRDFPGWQDELDTPDDAPVVVCENGSVSCAETGDRIAEDGFGGGQNAYEYEDAWREYWDFNGFSRTDLDLSSDWDEEMSKYEGNICTIGSEE